MAANNPSNLNISTLSYMNNNGSGSIRFNCVGIREPGRCTMRISLPADDGTFCTSGITELIAPPSDTQPGTYRANFSGCTAVNWPDPPLLLGFIPAEVNFDLHGGGGAGDTDIDNHTDTIFIIDPDGLFIERAISFVTMMGVEQ